LRESLAAMFDEQPDPIEVSSGRRFIDAGGRHRPREDVANRDRGIISRWPWTAHRPARADRRRLHHRRALVFDFINGFTTPANSIATVVSTGC